MTAAPTGKILPFHRDYNRVFDGNFEGWPENPVGYTFLGDLVHEACQWLFPEFQAFQKLPRNFFSVVVEQLRRDAIAGRIVIGAFEQGRFVPIDQELLLGSSWQLLFRCCRRVVGGVQSAPDLFVRDEELDSYVSYLDQMLAEHAIDG